MVWPGIHLGGGGALPLPHPLPHPFPFPQPFLRHGGSERWASPPQEKKTHCACLCCKAYSVHPFLQGWWERCGGVHPSICSKGFMKHMLVHVQNTGATLEFYSQHLYSFLALSITAADFKNNSFISSVHTRCIVKTSRFTRGVCKNRGFY